MRLDVLHVLASDRRRGAEMFGFELHGSLAERGVKSDICCVASAGEGALPVRPLGSSRFALGGLQALRAAARSVNVVVAHGSSALLECGAGLVGLQVPFVYVNIGDPRYWAGTRLRRLRAGWLIRRAAAVVAISPGAREVLVSHYGLVDRNVSVIPNGRSASSFVPADAAARVAARERLGVPTSADVVAIVGALSPEKRVDLAIDAVARLSGVVLLVAGDGPERAPLEVHAANTAPGRVRFLGHTDGAAGVLAAADALVLSSDSEGVPGVLIEAGLAGLPVIATDVGWVRDVVRPGITGVLVPPNRADLMGDGVRDALAARDEFGAAGRRHCLAEYEMGAVTDKWLDVLLDISLPN